MKPSKRKGGKKKKRLTKVKEADLYGEEEE